MALRAATLKHSWPSPWRSIVKFMNRIKRKEMVHLVVGMDLAVCSRSSFSLFFFHFFNSVAESDVCAATVLHVNINNNNLPLVAQFIRRFLLLVHFFSFRIQFHSNSSLVLFWSVAIVFGGDRRSYCSSFGIVLDRTALYHEHHMHRFLLLFNSTRLRRLNGAKGRQMKLTVVGRRMKITSRCKNLFN